MTQSSQSRPDDDLGDRRGAGRPVAGGAGGTDPADGSDVADGGRPTSGDVLEELQAELDELGDDRPPAGGPAYQLVSAAVVTAVGLGGAVMSWGYGLGRLTQPGPGLWPFVISVLIAVIGVGLLVGGRGLTDSEVFTRSSLLPLAGAGTFVALAVLMPMIGFEIPSLLLCVVWLRFLGGESWRTSLVGSLLIVGAFYLLFVVGFSIPIPRLA